MPSKAQRLKMGLEKLQEHTLKVSGPEPEAHNWLHYQPQSLWKPPPELHQQSLHWRALTRWKGITSNQRTTKACTVQAASRGTRTYWKAANIPSSSSSSHGSILSAGQMKERSGGVSGMDLPAPPPPPPPTGLEKKELSRSLSPSPPLKKIYFLWISLEKNPQTQFSVCVCVCVFAYVYIFVCSCVFFLIPSLVPNVPA